MIDLMVPKSKKYKTNHMYTLKNIKRSYKLDYGDWGVAACVGGIITPNQIKSSRFCISKHTNKLNKTWIKILPDHIISKKSSNSRMGSGKGKPFKWVFIIKPGTVIFESTKIPFNSMLKIFKLIKSKLPIKVKLLVNKNVY